MPYERGHPTTSSVQVAGDPSNPRQVVPRDTIKHLSTAPLAISPGESGRLQLARWLTRSDHPLTPRVIVNRIWQHHFGRGIVATPSNFGKSGAPPTHPELLDYLAAEFVAHGWSIKQLHRLILTSQPGNSRVRRDRSASEEIDPGNAYYWRHDRRRLDAEAIRDTMLAVSGRLVRERPGGHPFPAIEDWHWTQHNQFKDTL